MSAAPLIEDCLAFGDIKVWSLLATLFGDRAFAPGATLAGPHIQSIVEPLGTRPEALRVALHRLRKDGWIDSRKEGRVSLYHMTALAQEETRAVRDLVYARHLDLPPTLWLVHTPEPNARNPIGLPVGRNVFLATEKPEGSDLAGSLSAQDVPTWVASAAIAPRTQSRFRALCNILEAREMPECETEVEREALRLILLHAWRRLVLRENPLALSLQPETAPAHQCRLILHDWLTALA